VSVIVLDALLIGFCDETVAWVDWRDGYAHVIPALYALWDSMDRLHNRPVIDD
jgi:hypothetical protein